MKNLSLINNIWIQKINPNITPQEKIILEDRNISSSEAKKALVQSIRSRSQKPASEEDAAKAQAIYDQHKLNDAVLIAADIILPAGNGIINCRVNGEHKQIRF